MSAVVDLTLAALAESGCERLAAYTDALRRAFKAHPAPFGQAWYGDKYRALAMDPQWLVNSLVINSEKEGEGSRKLWKLAGRTQDAETAEQVRRHAIDESGHSLVYQTILGTAFPGAVDGPTRRHLRGLSPGYTREAVPPRLDPAPERSVLDELVQMNIGEIRTRINQLLMGPVVMAYCPGPHRARLRPILARLLGDETRHIAYTGRLLERAMRSGHRDVVRALYARRLDEFNAITLAEVGGPAYAGS